MGADDLQVDVLEGFKSRPRVLARFFKQSRDKWKRKFKGAKAKIKYFKVRARDLEESRDHWRETSKRQQNELQRLLEENSRLRAEVAARDQIEDQKATAAG
jgi:hypothetical protein